MQWMEALATCLNMVFIILAIQNKRLAWFFGFFGAVCSFGVYLNARLYSDSVLHIFYAAMAVYGWDQWGKTSTSHYPYRRLLGWTAHAWFISIASITALGVGRFWSVSTDASLPYWDAGTTVFSIGATFLQAKRYLSNWVYWFFIDLICIGIYIHKELYWFTLLFIIYTCMAVWGFIRWKKLERSHKLS